MEIGHDIHTEVRYWTNHNHVSSRVTGLKSNVTSVHNINRADEPNFKRCQKGQTISRESSDRRHGKMISIPI